MLIWLPDPPPDRAARFIGTLVAAIVGGIVGGYVVTGGVVTGNPIPGIVAAAGGGAILGAAVALLSAKSANVR